MVIKRSESNVMVSDGPLDKKFENLVEETLELWHVPGISLAVVDGEKTFAKGYGIAALPAVPMSPSTLFFAGSTTKAFTAAVMATLVEDNEKYPQVQWDTPIHQLIGDDFGLENEYATTHITIEDALSHRSGLPRHDQAYGATSSGKRATVKEMIHSMRHLPLTAEPRTKYQYCNLMFLVAAHIIETLTGSKIGDLMKDRIWTPLDMTSTFSDLQDAMNGKDDLAKGYFYSDSDASYHEVEWMELDQCAGAGNIISNVLDYTKWARATISKTTPFSSASLEQLLRARSIMGSEEPYTGSNMYALGWRTGVYHGQQFFEHTGGMNAFGAELILFPDIEFAIVAFANTAGTSNFVEQVLAFHLVDEKLGIPMTERFGWNKKNQAIITRGQHNSSHAKSILYPELPSPTLPPTLPLPSYTGTYYHPGYQNLTIYFDDSTKTLHADRSKSTWPEYFTFEHVSGEFFIIVTKAVGDYHALFPQVYPAEFRIRADGRVRQVGIRWEETMGEEKIWLDRVEDK
ncbi:putative penicillin-binding protein [Mollisia scopiformis]|uniref:Putative penicillin-binding protein n=1 Tax=Mollisia scopiformis TaxID=149040 RepID=A0A194X3Z6_MOLSC|nr:putative penicillin-binding protein [Mollisia scopiformis]KUJ14891.1 putative penicillin-binding protein [Mollisia scopiformis]